MTCGQLLNKLFIPKMKEDILFGLSEICRYFKLIRSLHHHIKSHPGTHFKLSKLDTIVSFVSDLITNCISAKELYISNLLSEFHTDPHKLY